MPRTRIVVLGLALLLTAASGRAQESALDVYLREHPGALEEGSLGPLEARVLEALTPEQAEAYGNGTDPSAIVLESGETLAELMSALLAGGAGLVYVPLDACRAFQTLGTTAGPFAANESREYFVRGADLSAQGGSATGCMVPAEAVAVVMHFRAVLLAQNVPGRLRVKRVDGVPLAQIPIEYYREGDLGRRTSGASVIGLCEGACPTGEIEVTAEAVPANVWGTVIGYFRPIVAADVPAVGDADTLDGLDSTDFALVTHTHDGGDITSGTVGEPFIDSLIARDSEILPTVLDGDGSGSGLDADLLDGKELTEFRPRPANVLLVHPTDGDYATIQAALDDIGAGLPAASATNRYLVRVGSGDYAEQVTMKSFVDIEGKGIGVTRIVLASATPVLAGADDAELRHLSVINLGGGTDAVAIANVAASPMLLHVYAEAQGATASETAVLNDGTGGASSPVLTHVDARVHGPGLSLAGNQFGVRNINGASPILRDSRLSGGTAAIRNEDTSTARLANTQLGGPADAVNGAVQASYMCVRAYVFGTLQKLNAQCEANTPPTAATDSYATLGNTLLEVDLAAASGAPAVVGPDGGPLYADVLANDTDTETPGSLTATLDAGSVTVGAVVVMNADGSFSYTPPVGFTGLDSFAYEVSDPGGLTDTGTVEVTVSGKVWYVDQDNAGTADGRSATPFTSLTPLDGAAGVGDPDAAGDTVFVFDETTGSTTGGIELEDNQVLHGHGIALEPAGFDYAGGGALVAASLTVPTIEDTAGDVVELANGNTVRGLDIAATNGRAIFGSGVAGATVTEVGTSGTASGTGIRLDNATGTFTFSDLDVASSTDAGIDIQGGSASFTFDSLSSITNTMAPAFNVDGGSASIDYDGTISQANAFSAVRINGMSGGTVSFDGAITAATSTANGIDLTSNSGASFTFTGLLDIDTTTGTGFNATGGTVQVTHPANTLDTTGDGTLGNGIGINLGAGIGVLGVGFSSVSVGSSGKAQSGIQLTSTGSVGTFSVAGGTIQNTTSRGFSAADVDGTVSIGASIQNDGGRSVEITSGSAGAFTFDGAIDDDAQGIDISSNGAGGTFTFRGGLDIDTIGSNIGLRAFSGGTLNICADTNCSAAGGSPLANTVDTTAGTGIGVSINLVDLGAEGVTFESISTNGATSGIVLDATGSVAGSFFEVTGDGASDTADTTRGRTTAKLGGGTLTLGSGGSILDSTGPGVRIDDADNVTLRNLTIQDATTNGINSGEDGIDLSGSASGITLDNLLISSHAGNHGIDGSSVSGVTLIHTEVSSNATAAGTEGPDVHNVRFDNLTGTSSVTHSLLHSSRENIFSIFNNTGTLGLTATNIEVRDTTAGAPGNVGLLLDLTGSATVNATISGSSFLRNRARGVQFLSNSGSANGSISVRTSVFENSFVPIDVAHQAAGQTVTFDIDGNTINKNAGAALESNAINVVLGGVSAGTTVLSGCIQNNDIGDGAQGDSGSFEGVGILTHSQGAGTLTALVQGNTVRAIRQDSAFVGLATDSTGFLNLTFENNDFDVNPGNNFPLYGLDLTSGATAADSGTLRANFALSSRLVGDTFAKGAQILTVAGTPTIELQGYGGANNDAGAIATFVDTVNGAAPAPNGTSPQPADVFIFSGTVTGTVSAPGGVVPVPSNCS